jgi:two-component system, cell cycle response regulator CpdR
LGKILSDLGLSILIAEDNEFTTLQYNRVLEKCGHSLVITKNGKECIQKFNEEKEKCEPGKEPFDVVLLDQSMPKKNGKEVADEILKYNPNQRIIFASAYALGTDKEISEEFKQRVEFLQKPFSLSKLVRQVEN